MKHIFAILLCWTVMVEKPERVVDGDTFTVMAHIWHGTYASERVRVLDVDAVESNEAGGPAATAFATWWLSQGPFSIMTCKRDSFGRILAVVSRGNQTLAEELTKAGHVKVKNGDRK